MKDIFWMIQNPIVLSPAMRILKGSSIIGFLILSLILAPACENPVEPTVQPPKPPVQREKTPLLGLSYSEPNVIAEAGEAITDITPTLTPNGATAVYEVILAVSLPTGLELRENGIISGTPTTPAPEEIMVTIRASGSGEYTGSVTAEIRFTVNPARGIRTRRSLPGGISQVSYEAVQKGMTPAQIDTLIGISGSRRMDTPPTGGAVYVWQDSEHALKKSIQVWFSNDDKAEGLIFHDSTNLDAVIHLAKDFNSDPARDFTRAAYESITGDMTLAQVNEILGFDGTLQITADISEGTLRTYNWKASIFKDVTVNFIDGKAASRILTDRSVYPLDNEYKPLIGQVYYEAVQKGMTPAQIDTLIGISGSRRMDTPPTGGAVYVWQDSEHALKKSIQVWFSNDDKAEGLIFHDSTNLDAVIHLAKDFNSDPARDFTRAAYESITGDMTLAQVNEILGFDGTLQITADISEGTLRTYNWKASIFKDVTVNFIDGKAASRILTDRTVFPIDTDYTIF